MDIVDTCVTQTKKLRIGYVLCMYSVMHKRYVTTYFETLLISQTLSKISCPFKKYLVSQVKQTMLNLLNVNTLASIAIPFVQKIKRLYLLLVEKSISLTCFDKSCILLPFSFNYKHQETVLFFQNNYLHLFFSLGLSHNCLRGAARVNALSHLGTCREENLKWRKMS